MVSYAPSGLTFNHSTFCPHSVFMYFVWISEQTAIISLYTINWLACITETECLLRGTEWEYVIQVIPAFKGQGRVKVNLPIMTSANFFRHKYRNDRPRIQTGPHRQEATTTEAYKTVAVAQTFKAMLPPWPPIARYCCVLPVDWAAHWSFTQAAEHFASLDYRILKCCYLAFSWTETPSRRLNKPPTHSIEMRRDQLHFMEQNSLDITVNMLIELHWHSAYIYRPSEMFKVYLF